MRNIRTNPDGYTLDGYIAAKPGFWDAMEFTYRPATHAERVAYEDGIKQSTGAKKSLVMCEAIARHVKSWNETDEAGKAIGCTAATVGMVKNSWLADRLYNIITGWEANDERPTAGGGVEGDAGALIDSLLESVPPGVLAAERAEKN